jgi:hypothetical protein
MRRRTSPGRRRRARGKRRRKGAGDKMPHVQHHVSPQSIHNKLHISENGHWSLD